MNPIRGVIYRLAVSVILATTGCQSGNSPTNPDGYQHLLQTALKLQAKEALKDPDSASFRALQLYRIRYKKSDGTILSGGEYKLCGEVNARNGFGGYAGFKPFVSVGFFIPPSLTPEPGTNGVFFPHGDLDEDEPFQHLYAKQCKDSVENAAEDTRENENSSPSAAKPTKNNKASKR
jgi:hypothetical protein